MNVDLSCRQANSGRGIHGLQHVVDELVQLIVEILNWRSLLAQAFVRVLQNGKKSHAGFGQKVNIVDFSQIGLNFERAYVEKTDGGPRSCMYRSVRA